MDQPTNRSATSRKGAGHTETFRLATWNIHSAIGTDDRMDLRRVVSVITSIDADIIGLQEVGWHRSHHTRVDQFAYLRDHTDYQVVEGLSRDPLRSRFGNALLTRLPVLSEQWVDLKVVGHAPRSAIIADLGTGSARMRVAVTHLGLTPPEREIQAKRFVDAVASGSGAELPSLGLGDFNIFRESTRASRLLGELFPTCVSVATYPSQRPVFALDRIYLSPHWNVAQSRVLHSDLTKMVSDHLPLVADVVLATRPAGAGRQPVAKGAPCGADARDDS